MYRVIRFVGIIICRILFRFEIKGKENLKQDTNFMVPVWSMVACDYKICILF